MTQEQKHTEELVQKYISFLDSQLSHIKRLNGANSEFKNIQNAYINSITSCIEKAKTRMQEVETGAVWDNLVIAFFGETNAGKSTIIETFRILYNEAERANDLKLHPEGRDGEIVGDGTSDYTQVYKEYKMEISGVPFTLIDVPGIEGNEGKYEEEIKKALSKAHYVFYIQGQNKKPDTGTAGKIQKYLREWVKVYSVYNVRGIASNYDEEEERKTLLTDGEKRVEAQIEETFKNVLGKTYQGNISLQAYLALCSKAKFSPTRVDLQRAQKKIESYFGDRESLYQFSQFESLVNVVLQKSKNFTKEIVEANKEKHMALLHSMFNEIKEVSSTQEDYIKRLKDEIVKFQTNVRVDFKTAENHIVGIASRKYDALFYEIEASAMYAIEEVDGGKEAKQEYCEKKIKEICDRRVKELQTEISNEIKTLNDNIIRRKRNLDQDLSSANVSSGFSHIYIDDSGIGGALEKLDTNFGDISGHLISISGGIMVALSGLGPFGWILGGVLIAVDLLTGGRNKKAEAKEEIRKAISKAKNACRAEYNSQINRIYRQLDESAENITRSIETDLKNIDKLLDYINRVKQEIELEYSKLNIANYGTM